MPFLLWYLSLVSVYFRLSRSSRCQCVCSYCTCVKRCVSRSSPSPSPRRLFHDFQCCSFGLFLLTEPNSYKNHCGGTRWKYCGNFEIYCSTVWIPQCTLSARYYWQEYHSIIIMVLFKNHGNIMMHAQKHGNIMVHLWQRDLGNCGNYEVIKKVKPTTTKTYM